jgi:hypothetical protein
MKRVFIALFAGIVFLSLAGCSLSLFKKQPTAAPMAISLASPTALVPIQTPIIPAQFTSTFLPGFTPGLASTAVIAGVVPGVPSGPYGVIGVNPQDALNIRSGPGIGSPLVGTFSAAANNVMRTGPSSNVDGDLWVEVQNPAGGTGWVSSIYLSEYIPPASFCADGRVSALINNFGAALKASDGKTLAGLVSPLNGWSVSLWRNGNAVVFDREHAQWVFTSTFEHDWGAAPASGQSTVGSVHSAVFPKYLDVFNAPASAYSLICDAVQAGGASYPISWPVEYTNINFYSVYKPGPVGNELSWRTLLIGVEYVQNQPYIFSTSQLQWEP